MYNYFIVVLRGLTRSNQTSGCGRHAGIPVEASQVRRRASGVLVIGMTSRCALAHPSVFLDFTPPEILNRVLTFIHKDGASACGDAAHVIVTVADYKRII